MTSTAGVGLLAYAMLQASAGGWETGQTIGLLTGAGVLLGYFVIHETWVTAEPLVAFSLFGNRSLAAANAVTVLRGGAMFALFYFATLYQQQVLHYSALKTGLAYLPLSVILVLASGAGPTLVARFGIRLVLASGALLAAAGLAVFTQLSPAGTLWWGIVAPSAVVGLGFAIMVSLQLGGALGVAVLSTAATTRTTGQLRAGQPTDVALVDGFGLAFGIASAVMALTAVLAALLFGEQGRGQKVDLAELTHGSTERQP